MTGTVYTLEVNPQLPERLERLEELANNLWYSWDRPTRGLFVSLSHIGVAAIFAYLQSTPAIRHAVEKVGRRPAATN